MTKKPRASPDGFKPSDVATVRRDVSDAICKGLINLYQTPEERRNKYFICRFLGARCYVAQRLRDWRWNNIAKHFGYDSYRKLAEALSG